jgi:hypothetical protein
MGSVEAQLLDIVRVADRRNADLEVSGILAYDRFGYYQVVEGAFDAVSELRISISRDLRHRMNKQRLLPRDDRNTPLCLPMAFVQTRIPHFELLKPAGTHRMADFERQLIVCAAEKYPISYATG